MSTEEDAAAAPETVEQALSRAGGHARNAVAESLLAVRSLLDAVSIGLTGEAVTERTVGAPGARGALVSVATTIDQLASSVRSPDTALPQPLAEALLGALDAEIERWETRSQDDAEARAVLRAFLGLREILWELGIRRPTTGPPEESAKRDDPAQEPDRGPSPVRSGRGRPPRRARVQRIPVDG